MVSFMYRYHVTKQYAFTNSQCKGTDEGGDAGCGWLMWDMVGKRPENGGLGWLVDFWGFGLFVNFWG
jgi:hypothetical protein